MIKRQTYQQSFALLLSCLFEWGIISMIVLQQWLTKQRQAKNLTLDQLAKQLNKSVSYVQDVESGQYQLDVVEYLFYCKALDINPNHGLELIQSNLTSI